MKIEGGTSKGAIRPTNQDAQDCGSFSKNAVWGVVCDGMGGASGGNVASSLAVKTIKAHLTKQYKPGMTDGNIKAMLNNAMAAANRAVFDKANGDATLRGMGTTAVVLLATKESLHVAHVGDSRAYLKTGEELERLTADHSFVQNLVDFGQITEEEALHHPKRNIITRAIGVHEAVRCDYSKTPLKEGDIVLACTDGLTNYASDEVLKEQLTQQKGKKLINQLIQYAIDAGGADNITVMLIENT